MLIVFIAIFYNFACFEHSNLLKVNELEFYLLVLLISRTQTPKRIYIHNLTNKGPINTDFPERKPNYHPIKCNNEYLIKYLENII